MNVFRRVDRPRLAAVALAGVGWWLVGLVLGLVGPQSLAYVSTVVHLLGLGTLLLTGAVYGVLWWTEYVQSRLG